MLSRPWPGRIQTPKGQQAKGWFQPRKYSDGICSRANGTVEGVVVARSSDRARATLLIGTTLPDSFRVTVVQ
jgi:hypothetical protein